MVFQGLDGACRTAVWQPFFDWLAAAPPTSLVAAAPVIDVAGARTSGMPPS